MIGSLVLSQSLRDLSWDEETTWSPLGLMARHHTSAWCPWGTRPRSKMLSLIKPRNRWIFSRFCIKAEKTIRTIEKYSTCVTQLTTAAYRLRSVPITHLALKSITACIFTVKPKVQSFPSLTCIWKICVLLENNHLQGLDVFKLVSIPLFDLSVLSGCEKQMGFGDKLKEHYAGKREEGKYWPSGMTSSLTSWEFSPIQEMNKHQKR